MKVIILAGGTGTRLWPISRENNPKQVLPIIGKETLLQKTYNRLRLCFGPKDIFVVTGAIHNKEVKKQIPSIPKENIFIEPIRKDSAGAIGLAASCIYERNPKEIIITAHSDSWFDKEEKFVRQISSAAKILDSLPNYTLAFGIKPSYPETGYGYIKASKKNVHYKKLKMSIVDKFIEKPNPSLARKIFFQKDVFWNIGWFAWRADHLMDLYKKYLLNNFCVLKNIAEYYGKKNFQSVVNKEFPKLKSIAVDYAILEKTKDILLFSPSVNWSDIGNWRVVKEMSKKDKNGNTSNAPSVLLDSKDNFFMSKSGKLIAAVGVNGLIMVETDDSILLSSKDRAQDVKKIVENLKNNKFKKFL